MKKLFLTISLTAFLVGCTLLGIGSSNFQTLAGKFLSSTAIAVDTGMQSWAVLVVQGLTSTNQEAVVRSYYGDYQLGMMVATNAYTLALTTGDTTLFTNPSNNLFSVKTSFLNAVQTPK